MSARRALWRWSWRVLVKERRQQAMVVALVALAVAAGGYVVLGAYQVGVASSANQGSATHTIFLSGPESSDGGRAQDIDDQLRAVKAHFGEIDVTRSSYVDAGWWPYPIELREEAVEVGFGRRPTAEVLDGSRPTAAGEVALTKALSITSGASVGDGVSLGEHELTVTGIIEDPTYLDNEYALVAPGQAGSDHAEVLVRSDDDTVAAFAGSDPDIAWVTIVDDLPILVTLAYTVTSFAMLEVVLLAAAGFTVIAHRRLRQFGMLAAAGATDRHLRQAMVGNGLAVGLVGGPIGMVAALAVFVASQGGFEELVGFRVIDPLSGWWIAVPTVGLGVVACAVAAWWPARMVARTPVTDALASRRPRPLPAGRSATAGLVASGCGAAVLSLGFNRANGWLAFAGLVAAVVGVLLLAPAAIRVVGAASVHLPVGARIAARELARHQSRSAAAVAALVLVLGIPAAIAVTSASADVSGDGETVNLDDSMVIVGPAGGAGFYQVPSDFDAGAHRATAERLAETLGPQTTLVDIDVAVDPEVVFQDWGGPGRSGDDVPPLAAVNALRPIPGEDGSLTGEMAWVATPAMLAALGLDPELAQSPVEALSARSDAPIFGEVANPVTAEQVGLPKLSSIPDDLITAAGIERGGYEVRTAGWLLVAGGPLTAGQRSAAIDQVAADSGLEVELPAGSSSAETVRLVVAIVGSVVALAIMAMVISLVRSESAAELRSLAAVGASGLTQRGITAASAGLLSLAGAVLAIPLGYLALLAIMSDRAAQYPFVVPVSSLSLLVIGVPLAATAAGWLLGGREPAELARTPLG